MGSGYSGLYPTLGRAKALPENKKQQKAIYNGTDYNSANSSEIQEITKIKTLKMGEKIPAISTPNSVAQKKDGDKVITERYYNSKGEPYIDLDYTDHGNPTTHKIVPHKHNISYNNGNFKREEPGKEIQ